VHKGPYVELEKTYYWLYATWLPGAAAGDLGLDIAAAGSELPGMVIIASGR
jgi:hypothetical protein